MPVLLLSVSKNENGTPQIDVPEIKLFRCKLSRPTKMSYMRRIKVLDRFSRNVLLVRRWWRSLILCRYPVPTVWAPSPKVLSAISSPVIIFLIVVDAFGWMYVGQKKASENKKMSMSE